MPPCLFTGLKPQAVGKLLIITSNFFPDPVVGAVRATQWARLLPEHGWQVDVARKHHGYSATGAEVSEAVHPHIKVHFISDAPSPFTARRLGRLGPAKNAFAGFMGRFMAPDTGILFWTTAGDRLARLVGEIRPDAVITTGPPHSVHTAGMRLKKSFPDLCWVADFRDVYHAHMRREAGWMECCKTRGSLRHEAEVYRAADHITCTFPAHKRWIARRFPAVAGKTTVVTNGVPSEIAPMEPSHEPGRQTGWIKVVGFSEAPETVALASAVAAVRRSGETIGLRIVGRPPSVRPEITKILGSGAEFTGMVAHARALEEIASARILVTVLSEQRSRIPAIASKLFEYLAIPAPVIVLNPSNAARTMFSRLSGLWMLTKPAPAGIEAAILAALRAPEDELRRRALLVRERWSRSAQAAQLASILDDLVKKRDVSLETRQAAPGE